MARFARVEVFASDEIAVVHVMARTVRRCFLLGDDAVTGKNYDHRKQWIDDKIVHQARHFGIDLLCQSILSNHFHLVLRSRPDMVKEWDNSEVALATTIEGSDFTPAQKRLHDLQRSDSRKSSSGSSEGKEATAVAASGSGRHLAPMNLKERSGETGPCVHKRGQRCSNKGFLPMSTADYLVQRQMKCAEEDWCLNHEWT